MVAWSNASREVAGFTAAGISMTLALLRDRRRAFHPEGCCFRARLEVYEREPLAEGLLPSGQHRVVMRLSRAAGLPARCPDVLGVALRVEDVHGAELDLLFNSSAPGAVGKFVMLPARRFFERPYTTLGWYHNRGHEVLVGLLPPAGPGPTFEELRRTWNLEGAVFDVVVAPRDGGWRHAGWLIVGDPCPEGETLVFDPWNVPGPARPGGFLNWLRIQAYPASQDLRAEH